MEWNKNMSLEDKVDTWAAYDNEGDYGILDRMFDPYVLLDDRAEAKMVDEAISTICEFRDLIVSGQEAVDE